ncbi:MAG: hypothetical protein ACR2QC_06715 [Gammaproteobacteria bacterium]
MEFSPEKNRHSGESRNLLCAKRKRRIRLAANEIPVPAFARINFRRNGGVGVLWAAAAKKFYFL